MRPLYTPSTCVPACLRPYVPCLPALTLRPCLRPCLPASSRFAGLCLAMVQCCYTCRAAAKPSLHHTPTTLYHMRRRWTCKVIHRETIRLWITIFMLWIMLWKSRMVRNGKWWIRHEQGMVKNGKNTFTRFTQNNCSRTTALENLGKYVNYIHFAKLCSRLIRQFYHFSHDNIHYHVNIMHFTGGGFWNLFPFLEENSQALSTFPPSYTNPPISTFPPSLSLPRPPLPS